MSFANYFTGERGDCGKKSDKSENYCYLLS